MKPAGIWKSEKYFWVIFNQYYSIIESCQFEHLLDLTSNLSELKTIFTWTHYIINDIFSYLCPSAEIYRRWIVTKHYILNEV